MKIDPRPWGGGLTKKYIIRVIWSFFDPIQIPHKKAVWLIILSLPILTEVVRLCAQMCTPPKKAVSAKSARLENAFLHYIGT